MLSALGGSRGDIHNRGDQVAGPPGLGRRVDVRSGAGAQRRRGLGSPRPGRRVHGPFRRHRHHPHRCPGHRWHADTAVDPRPCRHPRRARHGQPLQAARLGANRCGDTPVREHGHPRRGDRSRGRAAGRRSGRRRGRQCRPLRGGGTLPAPGGLARRGPDAHRRAAHARDADSHPAARTGGPSRRFGCRLWLSEIPADTARWIIEDIADALARRQDTPPLSLEATDSGLALTLGSGRAPRSVDGRPTSSPGSAAAPPVRDSPCPERARCRRHPSGSDPDAARARSTTAAVSGGQPLLSSFIEARACCR